MNEPDHVLLRLLEKAEDDYRLMAQPYIAEIAKIRLLFGAPYMIVNDGNIVVEHGVRLSEEGEKWTAQLVEMIKYCRELSLREVKEYTERFTGAPR